MSSAICWKNVQVVRPQPGHAVTCGVKLRMPMRLENLLRHEDFFGAVAAWAWA